MIPKFRAWLIGQEYMAEIEAIAFRGDGNVDVYTSLSGNDFYAVGEECELIQSTGLHDKNGVEIFVDDIVKNGGEHWQCIFKVTSFKLVRRKYKTADDGTRYFDYYSPTQYTSYKEFSQCEVVGNIYENPELLEQ